MGDRSRYRGGSYSRGKIGHLVADVITMVMVKG